MYIEMIRVSSSFIKAVGYDDGTLYVEFHSGFTYPHPHVPYRLFEGLRDADSPGTFYNQNIRGKYK